MHVNKGEHTTQPIKKHCSLLKTVMNRLPTSQGEQLIYMKGGEYSSIKFVFLSHCEVLSGHVFEPLSLISKGEKN